MASWFDDRKGVTWKNRGTATETIVEDIECAKERREKERGEREWEKERHLSEKQKRADRIEGVAKAKEDEDWFIAGI